MSGHDNHKEIQGPVSPTMPVSILNRYTDSLFTNKGDGMANTHPYISGAGNIAQMVAQLRKSFPSTISSETVKKLGIAPNNESYVINVLQYIGVVDSEGKKTPGAAKVFSHHKDDEFAKEFASLVEKAYSSLFDIHGSNAWQLDNDELITFFRQSDQTSATIGGRQANTFKILAALSGHGDTPEPKPKKATKASQPMKQKKTESSSNKKIQEGSGQQPQQQKDEKGSFGLTVRVEINLPADGTKETYDNIFKSIKENLLGG